jgi:hypothetical protein
MVVAILALAAGIAGRAADETVTTALYARVGNGYQREQLKNGTFKPEYYALGNGGRIAGTSGDLTVDRVTYPMVAEIAMRLLGQQNYHYAQSKEQAKLLLVLQWGSTIAPNGINYGQAVNQVARIMSGGGPAQGMGSFENIANAADSALGGPFEDMMIMLLMENRERDKINAANARVLGYFDDLNESNDIRRWAGGGDRYNDLIGDVEESRYYIVISAYDFPELEKQGKKKLLWQTRVSVRTPGNAFDDSVVAMMKSASKYFGQDSGRLIRHEESKGTVELGDLKFLGEAKEPEKTTTKEKR